VSEWFLQNALLLNADKTEAAIGLVFGTLQSRSGCHPLTILIVSPSLVLQYIPTYVSVMDGSALSLHFRFACDDATIGRYRNLY